MKNKKYAKHTIQSHTPPTPLSWSTVVLNLDTRTRDNNKWTALHMR